MGVPMADQKNKNNNPDSKEGKAISRSIEQNIPLKQQKKEKDLSGVSKVAILLVALGSELASSVFKNLNDQEIQMITKEIANIKKITSNDKTNVLKEFEQHIKQQQFISKGGEDLAKDILLKAFGQSRANEIYSNIHQNLKKRPFEFLNHRDPHEIFLVIKDEHPQTMALTLSYIEPNIASKVIKELPSDQQSIIAQKIATMDRIAPDIIESVENTIMNKLTYIAQKTFHEIDGVNTLAEILNNLDRDSEKKILNAIEDENQELAVEIRDKMFQFEDIIHLTDREVQRLMELLTDQDISMALKGEENDVRDKIFRNITKVRKNQIEDEILILGQVRYRDVYKAQQNILNVLKQLETEGKVFLKSRNPEDFVS